MQTLLQYLYDERAETRLEAMQNIVAYEWDAAQVREALEELAALDETPRVRDAARDALREIEAGVS